MATPSAKKVLAENIKQQVVKDKKVIDDANKLAKKIKPHLIILDVMMPEMDGIEACEIIRNDSEIGNALIAFLSARGEDYSQVAGFNAGADDYITKPIKPKLLKSKIKSLLRRISQDEAEVLSLIHI